MFKKKSNLQVVVALGACITNIIGNTILVPKMGCQGAAISTGISYIVFYVLRTVLGQKYYYVDFKLKRFFIITGTVCIYAFYNMFFPFSIYSVLGYLVCLILIVLLYRKTVLWILRYGIELIQRIVDKQRKG